MKSLRKLSLNIKTLVIIASTIVGLFNTNTFGQFVQIESILVDACDGTDEGKNEMVRFRTTTLPINVADIRVDGANSGAFQTGKWPTVGNSFSGWITPGTANHTTVINKINQINSTITNCGLLILPTGGTNNQGIIPAGKKAIIITSYDFTATANDFSLLSDTIYVIVQNASVVAGNFGNYLTASGNTAAQLTRKLRLWQISTGLSDDVTYYRNLLIDQLGVQTTADGAGVRYTDAGVATYYNDGCQAPYIPLSAEWVGTTICQSAAVLDLNTLLAATATTGGTWSGTGVTGSNFSPAGLSGNIDITYSVGTAPCVISETHAINVIASANATWVAPGSICQSATALDLNTLLAATATTGGTWSGTGVTGNNFSPAGLTGNISVTYTIGVTPCIATESHNINVITSAIPTWTAPAAVCQSATALNLNTLLSASATTGGTWSGTGVTGNNFNPTGLSGNINITYTVGSAPCTATESHNINVIPTSIPTWVSPGTICQGGGTVNLNTLLPASATTGGTWSGTGVFGTLFNPSTLSGTYTVTYTVGPAPCAVIENHDINVIPSSSPAWTAPAPICQSAAAINLNTLLAATATSGGTWSGTGVTGNNFNPAGLSGNINVTYTIGTAPCVVSESHNINVATSAIATWTAPTSLCQSAGTLDLTTLISATTTTGGTWSGTGVTGTIFNPSGLNGNINITYTAGTAPCTATESHNINVITAADATWTAPAALCQSSGTLNLNSLLSASATLGGTWSGTGVSGNTFSPTGLAGNINITYSVGTAPCSDTESHDIVVLTNANASWNPPTSICASSDPVDLTQYITGDTGGTWSGQGIIHTQFTPTGLNGAIPIMYVVQSSTSCPDTVIHNINVTPAPIASLNIPSIICKTSATFDLNTLLTGTPGGTWSGDGITSNIIDLNSVGNSLSVMYKIANVGCADSVTATLNFSFVEANFTLTPDNGTAPLEISTTNLSNNAISYQWNFGNGVYSSETNPSTTYIYQGTYSVWLKATSAEGCVDSTYKTVTIIDAGDFIPNVFTPNEDGINDQFFPVISKLTEDYHMMIFNRWGNLIFETTEQTNKWDGTYLGELVPFGVYFYVISFNFGNKHYYYNGTVTAVY